MDKPQNGGTVHQCSVVQAYTEKVRDVCLPFAAGLSSKMRIAEGGLEMTREDKIGNNYADLATARDHSARTSRRPSNRSAS